MPEAPILVLLPSPAVAIVAGAPNPGRDEGVAVLGLSLARRAVLAARRAGYGRLFFLAKDDRQAPEGTENCDWMSLAAAARSSGPAPVLIAPATILAQTDWLTQLAEAQVEPAAWAAKPGRMVMLSGTSAPEALEALSEEGAAHHLGAVERCLKRRFGPPAALPIGVDPMVVTTPADVRAAERRLLASLVKETDGFMARHVERPISLQVSRLLALTAITPNQMSLISIVIGVCGGPFFLSQSALSQTIGAMLFLMHSILDGCDGELARLKFRESRWGGVLDFWGDNVVHAVIFACMGLGWSRAAGAAWPLWLGAAAVLGTMGSAGFVYWRLMRPKDGGGALFTSVAATPERPLARLLDAASRRDFIYLVLILALIGKSNWFLALAAIGAPIYFLLVLILAARERLADPRVKPGGTNAAGAPVAREG